MENVSSKVALSRADVFIPEVFVKVEPGVCAGVDVPEHPAGRPVSVPEHPAGRPEATLSAEGGGHAGGLPPANKLNACGVEYPWAVIK